MMRATLEIVDDHDDTVSVRRAETMPAVAIEIRNADLVFVSPAEARKMANFLVALAFDIENEAQQCTS